MHIAVNTAMSLPVTVDEFMNSFTTPRAAPADPKAVIGTAMNDSLENPKIGLRIKESFSPKPRKKGNPLV